MSCAIKAGKKTVRGRTQLKKNIGEVSSVPAQGERHKEKRKSVLRGLSLNWWSNYGKEGDTCGEGGELPYATHVE